MGRTIHALLLIASLITCPGRCWGIVDLACAASEASAACSCCAHRCETPRPSESEQSTSTPASPADDCQCGNCVCKGAVLGDDDPLRAVSLAEPLLADSFLLSDSLAADHFIAWRDVGPPLESSLAGRDRRLALQSLQI